MNLNELETSPTCLVELVTEADPDGADRGGYLILSHTLQVAGPKLTYTLSSDDEGRYVERLGEFPAPEVENKEEALTYLRKTIATLLQTVRDLEALALAVAETTEFECVVPESEADFDDDSEDEDDKEAKTWE
mgnify:CR=1 FL=1